jgi:hypothetical protein
LGVCVIDLSATPPLGNLVEHKFVEEERKPSEVITSGNMAVAHRVKI